MKRVLLMALAAALLAAPAAFAAKVKEHPLIRPYEGSKFFESKVVKFDHFEVPTGRFSFDNELQKYVPASSIKVAGKVTEIQYLVPMERSGFEVFSNYESALRQGGFEILYSCQDKACGRKATMATKYLSHDIWIAGEGGLLSARLARPDGDVYAVIAISGKHHKTAIYVIEAKPMESGMVKVDADALLNDIERTGHASIYGIYFATGKAEVKPESKQALGEIAKLLKNRPGLKLHVVGHTDNTGGLEYNMGLSRQRARAVVTVLVRDYGIDAGRLHAAGVGPLAPVLANTSDAGRAKNRRVELVAR